jgi:diphthamide synthase (EF-2-diphthine--ammonia ligase)
VCGENGEYHTAVTVAPLFARQVLLAWDGDEERDGHYVLKYRAERN